MNYDLRLKLGENAYNMDLNNFHPLQNAQKFEVLYQKFIQEKNFK